MRPVVTFGLFFLISQASGCRTTPSGATLKDITYDVQGYPAPATCGQGESALTFQLSGPVAVQRSDLGLTGDIQDFRQQTENDDVGFRLDLCTNDATTATYLKQLVQRQPNISAFNTKYNAFIPDSQAVNPAWQDAIIHGGSTDLQMEFRDSQTPTRSLLVKGWKNAGGTAFISVSNFDGSGSDPLTITSGTVTYGTMVQGDPWITSYKKHDRLITAPNLRIELHYDVKPGQNNYKGYRVHSVHLKDSNPALATPLEATLSEPDFNHALEVKYTHHSLSDQFVLTFPSATYTIGQGLTVTYSGGIAPMTIDLHCQEVSNCGTPLTGPVPAN